MVIQCKIFFKFFLPFSANRDIKGDIMRKRIKEERVLHGEEAKQRRMNWSTEQRKLREKCKEHRDNTDGKK